MRLFGLLVTVFCVFCGSLPSIATAQRVIPLSEALQLTLDYSRDVLIAAEGKKQSEGRYIEERSAALPQLTLDASAVRLKDNVSSAPGKGLTYNGYNANVNLTQALFTWGQIGAAINAAKHDREATEQQYREARQLAMREAATAYYDLLLTLELAKVARDNVAQKQRHLDEATRKHQAEVATDYDVLSARVALTNAQPTLTRAENDIRLATDRLRYYMGIDEDFEPKGPLQCSLKAPFPLSDVLQRAQENRPEVAFYESRVGVFRELIKVAKGNARPRLDFKANAGRSGIGDLNSDVPGDYWDAGVYLSFPIFDGLKTKGQVIQARSRLATTEYEMKRLLDQIGLDARAAINGVDEAIQIIKGLEATIAQAERLLAMAETGYRAGVKTKLEVDDAETDVLTAKVNLARARRDYLRAWTLLSWIMGENLQEAVGTADWTGCRLP
ncbi:MAG: TolC family protein [Syntrophobacteraceae bacterium]